MRMKSRVARKILRDMTRLIIEGDKPPRHTWAQWLQATFVENRHTKWRISVEIDGKIVMRTAGGLANENLCRTVRKYGFRV